LYPVYYALHQFTFDHRRTSGGGLWIARFVRLGVTATIRRFEALLIALSLLVALNLAVAWRLQPTTSQVVTASRAPSHAPGVQDGAEHSSGIDARGTRHWLAVSQRLSFILCGVILCLAILIRRKGEHHARGQESAELALERRVEERTRELRQEIEDRKRAEHLNRGHKQILEMLAEPGDLETEDILRYLAEVVASRNQGWECAVHLLAQRGKPLEFAASSEVNDRVRSYLKDVGTTFADTPECTAAASGEVQIAEHLIEIGKPWSELLVANGLFSAWSIPFFTNGSSNLSGTLTIYSRSRCKPDARELELVESAARLAALVIEHRRIRSELINSAYRDALTGLPNRRAGEEAIEAAIAEASRRGESVAVLWIDVNRFKRINEQYGHETGNHVLRTVAERLRRNPLSTGTVARMGEDEFLVLIPGKPDSLDTVEMARRLGAAVGKPVHSGPIKIPISASIGVCVYPQDGVKAVVLERNADFALYRAKAAGAPYCIFSAAMSEDSSEALEIEEALGEALEKNYLRLVYQPLYAQTGELTGFESLLRFQHPKLGNVSPGRFIPLAEETRLIMPIGTWVLREACRQLRAWEDAGHPKVRMSVNISALQFARDDFADTVARIITECNVAPENLVLELTESVVMEDYETVVRQMNLLRQCGVHIAMDDFGTGYSSLSYIHRIPVDVLKIDRSFIERLADPDGTRPIVEAVIAMARHLGMVVVAEGVETVEQQCILEKAGCNGFQGFLFARPLEPEDAENCLKACRTTLFANPSQQYAGGLAVA
jgi:diguanylate cyclase (GGDEF)-like protein